MLKISELQKRYGEVLELDGVSLTVARGQAVGFLGPNGSGKTTTMRSILGLVSLDSGSITWDGRPIDAATRRRIGYLPAERGMYPKMKVRDHVVYFARLAGLERRHAGEAADSWLERVGLSDRGDSDVQDLSSGNQQRVQLALALVHDPELLVLDEPFSGLDPVAVGVLQEILLEQVSGGAALVFSSHQLDLVEDLAPDVVIIDRGRVVAEGDVDEIRARAPQRHAHLVFEHETSWQPAAELGEVTRRTEREVWVKVSAEVEPVEILSDLATGDGSDRLVSFNFAPPELSEIFLSVVGRP